MKAQFVFENIEFERGLEPKESLNIGEAALFKAALSDIKNHNYVEAITGVFFDGAFLTIEALPYNIDQDIRDSIAGANLFKYLNNKLVDRWSYDEYSVKRTWEIKDEYLDILKNVRFEEII